MVAPTTYIQPLTTIRRERMLRGEGAVLVQIGDLVSSGDIVAQSGISSKHIMLDVSRALGVPVKRVPALMQRQLGDKIEKGAIIAGRRAMGARLLRAPEDGRIVAISGGQLLFQLEDDAARLPARVSGQVVEMEPSRGVVIQCVCAWLQGLWGNGHFADGFLQLLAESPDQVLTADQIDMSMRGAILIAGHCNQKQALELAGQVPIRGLVLASLTTRLLPVARKVEYPILLTEGFGPIPMNADAHKLISNHQGEPATLNAQHTQPYKDLRPELLIPLAEAGNPPPPADPQNFRLGQTVRILRGPHLGAIGEITDLLPASTLFPSGIRARGAEVSLSAGVETIVPLANLDVLG